MIFSPNEIGMIFWKILFQSAIRHGKSWKKIQYKIYNVNKN